MNFHNKTIITLVLSLSFLLAVMLVPFIHSNIFLAVIGLLVFLAAIYFQSNGKEDRYDFFLILSLLAVFLLSKFLFRSVDQIVLVVRTAALLAFFLLHLVLLISPWSRFSARIRRFYFYRRHLGVTVFLLGSLHASTVFANYFAFSVRDTFSAIFTFYGFTAFFILLWMAATSWDVLQKKVSKLGWNILHALLALLYAGTAYYLYTIQKTMNDPTLKYHLVVIGIFLLFWLVVAPYSIIRKIMNTYIFGWKQLHVLLYVAYAAILLHAWLGFFALEQPLWKGLFWFGPFLIIGSHLTGWITRGVEDRRIDADIRNINQQFEEKGKVFIGVATVDSFVEGKGKKIYLHQQPLALFKQGNSFFAISNVCAHQKGPLYQGRFSGGVVECPWHYWTYNCKDGAFLGKEKFCLPVYETRVKEGILYVSEEPVNKEKVSHSGK